MSVTERDRTMMQDGALQKTSDAWPSVALADAPLEIIDGDRGKNYPKQHEFLRSGHCLFLNAGNVTVDGFNLSSCSFISSGRDQRLGKGKLTLHDIILTTRGTIGNTAHLSESVPYQHVRINSGMVVLRPSKMELDPRFLYLVTRSPQFRSQVQSLSTGSAQPQLPIRDIKQINIPLPPLPEQRAIAHVLGTLDDKIELNRRMNQTLEEMARALFKSWFVDFDPVRAKAALKQHAAQASESIEGDVDPSAQGRHASPADEWTVERARAYLDTMDRQIVDLFPDRLVDSELGEIPEGWAVGVLDDSIELISGGTPRTSVSSYWNGDIPWYTPKDAPSLSDVFVLETERTITQEGIQDSAARIVPVGTTIVTARGTVGRLACLGVPMAMNQTCYGIRGAHEYPDFFTYWNVRTAVNALQQRSHGTVFDTVTRQTFKVVETVLPPINHARAFESTLKPLMGRILTNLSESRSLAAQRDVLLPRLVSGEVGVGEVHSK